MSKKTAKKYYRKITEGLPQGSLEKANIRQIGHHLLDFSMFFMAILACFTFFFVGLFFLKYLEVKEARQRAMDNLVYWEDVARKHPNFPDGFYNAGLYASELGDKKSAEYYLNRAITLDPSFENAKELEKRVGE